MQREGADPLNMQPEDFICDFCEHTWSEDRPMVEGHRGSLICGKCLTLAHATTIVQDAGEMPGDDDTCTMCLMHKHDAPHWRSPAEGAMICKECVLRGGLMLVKDPETEWVPPTA